MKIIKDRHWIRFGEPKQSSSFTGDLAGKYLFFCEDQYPLIIIATIEIAEHDFEIAKVSNSNRSGDFVLCLYWHDDSRRYELRDRYKTQEDIKYRWWKSNQDTREGIYSEKFKNSPPDVQEQPMWDDAFGIFHE